jgi:hypothetical protein
MNVAEVFVIKISIIKESGIDILKKFKKVYIIDIQFFKNI